MALNKSKLNSGFKKIFDADGSPPSDNADCAKKMTKVIIDYLGDVKVGPLPGPGIFQPPAGPGPDASFSPQQLDTSISVNANQSIIENGLKTAMETNQGGDDGGGATKSGWAAADANFISYVTTTFVEFKDKSGYSSKGVTSPGPINLGSVLTSESDSFEDISSKLADHIHSFFTGCNFTGTYSKLSFLGTAPHVSPLI